MAIRAQVEKLRYYIGMCIINYNKWLESVMKQKKNGDNE